MVKTMLFIAQLTHPPELCLARPEHKARLAELQEFVKNKEKYAEEAGIRLHGSFINTNEHTFFFIIETDEYANVSKFLRGVFLSHHTAKITPVITLEELIGVVPKIVRD
jgi:hypothetical protein